VPTNRSYGDACPIARALDVVGERWALLMVRELLLGPQRFSDLRRALPGASSNLVSDRLRELGERGVVKRHRLPPPAGSAVYQLSPWGRELEPIVLALGEWGMQIPLPPEPTLSATSVLLYLRTAARPERAATTVWRLALDQQVWTVTAERGRVRIDPGETVDAEAGLATDPGTLNSLLAAPAELAAAEADHRARVTGRRAAVQALLTSVRPAASRPGPS
jgi:DNA-binding HxlR family transcriptional regulator